MLSSPIDGHYEFIKDLIQNSRRRVWCGMWIGVHQSDDDWLWLDGKKVDTKEVKEFDLNSLKDVDLCFFYQQRNRYGESTFNWAYQSCSEDMCYMCEYKGEVLICDFCATYEVEL